MHKLAGLLLLITSLEVASQDTTGSSPSPDYIWIFSSSKLINANTVELQPKGILEFKVTHNFGDIAGDNGGIKNFFGLDNAADIRIGFQYGLSKRVNLIAARAKGAGAVRELYELGFKYRPMQQANDPQHPLSVTVYANIVASGMEADTIDGRPNSFDNFSDRLSQVVQVMIARKFGKLICLQVTPTLVHTNYVAPGDENTVFALGGAFRLPIKGRFSLLLDYFHAFRSQSSIDAYKAQGVRFYDALGVGVEILTEGHVFHLNFTNATDILENRFIPYTITSWSKGQYRWGFTISRDFDLFFKKKKGK